MKHNLTSICVKK